MLFLAGVAPAACANADAFSRCAKAYADNDAERLKCFDRALAPVETVQEKPQATLPALSEQISPPIEQVQQMEGRSYMTRAWNLDNRPRLDSSSLDRLQPYQQNYLIVNNTSNVNTQPSSPVIGHTVLTPYDWDTIEAKFQLSFKADMGAQENLDILGLKTLRMWGAYTQQSYWQAFNTRNSSPFRETDYQPELIVSLATGNETGWKLLNLGWLHQSNGQADPQSRSWNRLYAQGGWEWGGFSLMGRGWWRIPENSLKDDNPDILHYMGHGDLVLRWEPVDKSQALSLLLRNNLSMSQNLGYMQLDWSMPVPLGHAARLHTQVSSGYGESLIDYNYRQTTVGMGISFREW